MAALCVSCLGASNRKVATLLVRNMNFSQKFPSFTFFLNFKLGEAGIPYETNADKVKSVSFYHRWNGF